MRTVIVLLILAVAASVCDAQWVRTSLDSIDVKCFAASGTKLFVGTGLGVQYPHHGVFLSTNSGASWNGAGLTEFHVLSLAVIDTNLFAGGPRVFRSTNDGTTWDSHGPFLGRAGVSALAVSGTNLFAGIDYGPGFPLDSTKYGVWLSTDNGSTWTAANAGLAWVHILALTVSGMNLFAGTEYAGVFLSTDNGTSWTARNSGLPTNSFVDALAVSGTNLFSWAYGPEDPYGGVYRSTNNGTDWFPANSGLPNPGVTTLAVSGTNLFAGTWLGGVFLSTNDGQNWNPVNAGLADTCVRALVVSGTNLFAGTSYNGILGGSLNTGVWKRPLSEMVTDVKSEQQLPAHFSLSQNYPNPFNPKTEIGLVSLKVFDVLGREVATLVNEVKQPGSYTVQWDASRQASGVYFYRLHAGSFVDVKKLILLR